MELKSTNSHISDDEIIKNTLWVFVGVTASGQYVWEDEGRNYLYTPAFKKNKLIRCNTGNTNNVHQGV